VFRALSPDPPPPQQLLARHPAPLGSTPVSSWPSTCGGSRAWTRGAPAPTALRSTARRECRRAPGDSDRLTALPHACHATPGFRNRECGVQGAGYGAGEVEWYEVRVPGLRVRRGAALVNSARVWVVIGLTSNARALLGRVQVSRIRSFFWRFKPRYQQSKSSPIENRFESFVQ